MLCKAPGSCITVFKPSYPHPVTFSRRCGKKLQEARKAYPDILWVKMNCKDSGLGGKAEVKPVGPWAGWFGLGLWLAQSYSCLQWSPLAAPPPTWASTRNSGTASPWDFLSSSLSVVYFSRLAHASPAGPG